MYRRIIICIVIALNVVLLSSCDKEHTKEYYIQNELDEKIIVKYLVVDSIESTIVEVGSTQLIYQDIYYFGSVGVSDERNNDKISNILVTYDSIQKMISEDIWNYEEQEKYFAKYLMKIDSSIFN